MDKNELVAVCLGLIALLAAVAMYFGYDSAVLTTTIASISSTLTAVVAFVIGKRQGNEVVVEVPEYPLEEM